MRGKRGCTHRNHGTGFALALGMLIDTFIVRPLILPAFVALTGRVGGGRLAQ